MGRRIDGFKAWLGIPPEKPFDPQARYVTSYLVSPFVLASWRSVVAVYTLVTLILQFVFYGAEEFSYFTILSYFGVWGYHAVAAIHTFSFAIAYKKWKTARTSSDVEANGEKNADIPRPQSWLSKYLPWPMQFLQSLLYSTIATFPLVVTIVFWTLLSKGDSLVGTRNIWSNLSVHAFNLLFTMLEVAVLGRGAMRPWSHCFFCVVLIAAYLGVAYITHATEHFYTYDFLDIGEHGSGNVAGTVVGIGAGVVVSFMIGQLIIFLRELTAAKIQGTGQWGSAKPHGVDDDALHVTHRGPGPEGEGGHRIDAGETQHAQDWRQRWPSNSTRPVCQANG